MSSPIVPCLALSDASARSWSYIVFLSRRRRSIASMIVLNGATGDESQLVFAAGHTKACASSISTKNIRRASSSTSKLHSSLLMKRRWRSDTFAAHI